MEVIDTDTGLLFHPYLDKELQSELLAHYASRSECAHAQLEVRRVIVGGGQIQYRNQCLECGELIGLAVAHAKAPKDAIDEDKDLAQRRRDFYEQQKKKGADIDMG